MSVDDDRADALDGGDELDEVAAEGNRIDSATRARDVTAYLARELVEDVDEVEVTASESRGEVTLMIHASPADLGRLIGRRGRVIQAVRQVARAAGAADGARINVEVAE